MKKRKFNYAVVGLTALTLSLGLASCDDTENKPTTSITETTVENVTVNFESQGTQAFQAKTGKPGESLALPTPTLTGYTFMGWYTDATLNTKFTLTTFPSESTTLYAKWEANYQDLTIIYNNGTKSVKKAYIESLPVEIEEPTLEGALFGGWYTDKDLTTKFEGTMTTSSLTVYAKWVNLTGTAFVSPTGTADGAGTVASPIDFDTALARMASNTPEALRLENIYLLGGTYNFSTRKIVDTNMGGTYDKYHNIAGVDGDNLAILNYSEQAYGERGFDIRADYIHMSNIIVERAGAYGIYVGGSHNIVENCVTRYNGNTGLGIARWDSSQNSLDNYPSDNLIKNCTSHDNFDYKNYGEDADGFSAKLTAGHNNVFDSCISFGNSDDGWDLYAKSSSGNTGITKIINCVAFANGFLSNKTDETNTGPYDNGRTRDGDGNGFKLGGEVMYGNVYLENCISFENGGHGFTDNSNPGILNLKNCTSYNNGLFGANSFSNYNLARTADSLNIYEGLLSVSTNGMIGIDNEDEFRGPTSYSIFLQANENKDDLAFYGIKDVINGNSRVDELSGSELVLDKNKIFASTEVSFYEQSVEVANAVHSVLRNADGSVNLGDYLKINNSTVLGYNNGNAIGGSLSASSASAYNHYSNREIPANADADTILAYNMYNQLFVTCNPNAVYEDLDLYKKVLGNAITWESSNTDVIKIDTETAHPKDVSKGTDTYYWAKVTNPSTDTTVTLTATITINEVTLTKEFVVTVKALNPIMGEIVGVDDYTIYQGDKLSENTPVVTDLNGRGENPTIDNELLTTDVKYFFKAYGKEIEVENIDSRSPGFYRVVYTISLNGTEQQKVKEINIEIVNAYNPITIKDISSNTTGVELTTNWTSGDAYVIAVANGSAAPTASQIEAGVAYTAGDSTVEVVKSATAKVNATKQLVSFDSPLYGEYTYYSVIKNDNGYSEVVSVSAVNPTYITTAEEFYALSQRNVANTEYIILSNDIDLTNITWNIADDIVFSGVFDGQNHKISNLTINYDGTKYAGLFTETDGATIKDLTVETVSIKAPTSTGAAALIGKASSTVVTNVDIKNVGVTGTEGIGGLIGQTSTGNVHLSKVSVTNTTSGLVINASKRYAGGLVGCFMGGPSDDSYNEIIITNAYVNANITCGSSGYAGGFVGRIKGNENRFIKIQNAICEGTITGKYAGTTTGGSDKNVLGCELDFSNIVSFVKIATNNADNGTMNGRLQSNTIQGLTMSSTYWVVTETNAHGSKTKDNANEKITPEALTEDFYSSMFDLTNTWTFENGMLTLK